MLRLVRENSYLAVYCKRLAARRGKKCAIVATAHSILTSIWAMFTTDSLYIDLEGTYFIDRADKTCRTRHPITALNQLGYTVQLDPNLNPNARP